MRFSFRWQHKLQFQPAQPGVPFIDSFSPLFLRILLTLSYWPPKEILHGWTFTPQSPPSSIHIYQDPAANQLQEAGKDRKDACPTLKL